MIDLHCDLSIEAENGNIDLYTVEDQKILKIKCSSWSVFRQLKAGAAGVKSIWLPWVNQLIKTGFTIQLYVDHIRLISFKDNGITRLLFNWAL